MIPARSMRANPESEPAARILCTKVEGGRLNRGKPGKEQDGRRRRPGRFPQKRLHVSDKGGKTKTLAQTWQTGQKKVERP